MPHPKGGASSQGDEGDPPKGTFSEIFAHCDSCLHFNEHNHYCNAWKSLIQPQSQFWRGCPHKGETNNLRKSWKPALHIGSQADQPIAKTNAHGNQ
jgi:hypothetical protein